MKKRIISIVLILLLVFALTACGSMRASEYDRDDEMTERMPNGDDSADDNTTTNGTSDYTMRNRTVTDEAQMMPDPEDGYIREDNADDGIVESQRPTTSPRISGIR